MPEKGKAGVCFFNILKPSTLVKLLAESRIRQQKRRSGGRQRDGVERRGLSRLAELLHIVTTSRFESFFEIIRYGMSREEAAEYNKLLSLYRRTGFEKVFFSGNVTEYTWGKAPIVLLGA